MSTSDEEKDVKAAMTVMKVPSLKPTGKRGEYEVSDADGGKPINPMVIKIVHWGSFAKRVDVKRGGSGGPNPGAETIVYGVVSATPCDRGLVQLRTSDSQENPAHEAPLPELYRLHQIGKQMPSPADVDRLVEYLGRSAKAAVDAVKQVADCIESLGPKMWECPGVGNEWLNRRLSPAQEIMDRLTQGLSAARGKGVLGHDAGSLPIAMVLSGKDSLVRIDVSDDAPEHVTLVLFGMSKMPPLH